MLFSFQIFVILLKNHTSVASFIFNILFDVQYSHPYFSVDQTHAFRTLLLILKNKNYVSMGHDDLISKTPLAIPILFFISLSPLPSVVIEIFQVCMLTCFTVSPFLFQVLVIIILSIFVILNSRPLVYSATPCSVLECLLCFCNMCSIVGAFRLHVLRFNPTSLTPYRV